LNCTYSGTELLNSYPPLKLRKFISHCVSMEVKARLLDQQNCKTKKEWAIRVIAG